ncbi:ABC transporter ATP-binding protein [Kushneria phosphatilytica]|uniref:sn-glycerol-3-phosphate ABC transporter ATP-binding protein UgpC n=1 Tax=Kushneria phosphatilytica TaxID=657387 RepID=A0A1S1NWK0_9GAMM|nr:sn-glycerol-3-phosphate ABC transporter ATP-binding protein UgpC [Kushneria phosphatilytica]OHV08668.1 ABC transporter [Kushneria phosphatilytica]QEL12385.1 sn-glycerol-3-phosphate ABC transporter ATP-binding protein UgpC [Kushneria phosphatilytica]
MANVTLERISKRFGSTRVIEDVSLAINDGEFVVFVGPSGCGKSTLLRLIAGLESITRGTLSIGEQQVNQLTPRERGIGMVFQSYALYPHMTVYQNMAFGLKLDKTSRQTVDERVRQTAATLQLEALLDRRPKALSGGQRQRVAIGRAMAREPRILLFDEPLSNLDAALRVQMRNEIARLHARLGSTMIYVTHDQIEAMTLADRIVVLNAGRVEQVGTPRELYEQPASHFVAGFIGSPKMNFLDATLIETHDEGCQVHLDGIGKLTLRQQAHSRSAGETLTLGIRPEHLRPCPAEDSHGFTVTNVEYLGNEVYLYLEGGNSGTLVCRVEAPSALARGDRVALKPETEHVHLFDREGHALPITRTQAAA